MELKILSICISNIQKEDEDQTTSPIWKKGLLTGFWFGCCQPKSENDTILRYTETTTILKTITIFFPVAFDKVHVNRTGDEIQTNVTGHEPSLLSNEIKWQLMNEKGMLGESEQERGEWGDFVQPGNWSHHKQIEFRSFWWARADQSIWPTTQCLSASQKDTLASNNRSTVNNWSSGSVSLS